jgi:OOP family OmpA-OmpF porin
MHAKKCCKKLNSREAPATGFALPCPGMLDADTLPAGSLRGDIKIQGANFDAVGSVPIGEKFSLFARAGLNYANSKDSFAGSGSVAVLNSSPHKWAANYKFGFGAEYDFNRFVGMRLEGERYRVDDAVGNKGDVDLYSAGLAFKFGRTEAAATATSPCTQAHQLLGGLAV